MNSFPLTPFLLSLPADGITVTPDDYARIACVLQTGDRFRSTAFDDIRLSEHEFGHLNFCLLDELSRLCHAKSWIIAAR